MKMISTFLKCSTKPDHCFITLIFQADEFLKDKVEELENARRNAVA